jgi:hypothetical protein
MASFVKLDVGDKAWELNMLKIVNIELHVTCFFSIHMECIIDNAWEEVGFEVTSGGYEEVWDIMQCSQLKINRRFGGARLLHPQDR